MPRRLDQAVDNFVVSQHSLEVVAQAIEQRVKAGQVWSAAEYAALLELYRTVGAALVQGGS